MRALRDHVLNKLHEVEHGDEHTAWSMGEDEADIADADEEERAPRG
jgi:hypothetical protein